MGALLCCCPKRSSPVSRQLLLFQKLRFSDSTSCYSLVKEHLEGVEKGTEGTAVAMVGVGTVGVMVAMVAVTVVDGVEAMLEAEREAAMEAEEAEMEVEAEEEAGDAECYREEHVYFFNKTTPSAYSA